MGQLPPVPPSTLLVEDALTGKVQSTELSQGLVGALFNDNSDQALRPQDPTALLAYAEAAQHGMRAGAPATTEAKNRTGWRLWTEFIREVGGDSPRCAEWTQTTNRAACWGTFTRSSATTTSMPFPS